MRFRERTQTANPNIPRGLVRAFLIGSILSGTIFFWMVGCGALQIAPTIQPTASAPRMTRTPVPTRVPPTITLAPHPLTKTLGSVKANDGGELFSAQVTLDKIEWDAGSADEPPTPGNTYLFVSLHVLNLGPGTIYSLSGADFEVQDAEVVLHQATAVSARAACKFDIVNLGKNKQANGCVAFLVPLTARLDFIYAPFHFEPLTPKRYLSFPIRN